MSRDFPRTVCVRCRMAGATCYCAVARPFLTQALFVLLVHPREARKSIGTARILRLCLKNAEFVVGRGPDFDRDERILNWITAEQYDPFVLYPGPRAISLKREPKSEKIFSAGKIPVLFVIDGTWHQARKMIQMSRVLGSLRQLAFEPERPSRYRIREQPAEVCVSSLEAVHELIERLDALGESPSPPGRAHDNLLEVFSVMVERQIAYEQENRLRKNRERVGGVVHGGIGFDL